MNRIANQDWAYGSPAARRYRERRDVLLEAELVRKPACEPVLRGLAMDRLPLRARAHLAVCASCRRAETELHGASRRGAILIVLVAVVALLVAIPIVTSGSNDDPNLPPPHAARGGAALVAQDAPTPVPVAPEAG